MKAKAENLKELEGLIFIRSSENNGDEISVLQIGGLITSDINEVREEIGLDDEFFPRSEGGKIEIFSRVKNGNGVFTLHITNLKVLLHHGSSTVIIYNK